MPGPYPPYLTCCYMQNRNGRVQWGYCDDCWERHRGVLNDDESE